VTHAPGVFCGLELAARIERAEAELIAGAARARDGFVTPIAGGFACFAEPGSPYNKVAGLGFDGLPGLGAVEREFAERGAPVQVEVAHLADPAVGALLLDRGYRLEGFENVLGRGLQELPERVPGIEVRRSGDDELEAWLDVVVDATLVSDEQGMPSHEAFPRETIATALRDSFAVGGAIRYSALRDGVLAGGASIRLAGGLAQMTGAATAPAHRRRGVQSALLAVRLADAAAAGCDLAVVTTQPASKSHENAQRQGFALLYTRAVWVKPLD
jgi:ribosomal protein S18 acetylase RimI-like enzyme